MAIFERVAERGSFAGAAEDVSLSPSAVAKLITRLELRLGVRLINRTTRRLALTAEGEIYLDRVREILGTIEAAESEIASARASPRGHLRVHTFPVIAAHEVAPALPDFLARHPHITFDFMVTNRSVDLVGENVDVSLRIGPLEDSALVSRKAGRTCRSRSSRMPDLEPKSRLGELAVSNQWQADPNRCQRSGQRR
jgi:DNA-binding transcriptional LysR family regulator